MRYVYVGTSCMISRGRLPLLCDDLPYNMRLCGECFSVVMFEYVVMTTVAVPFLNTCQNLRNRWHVKFVPPEVEMLTSWHFCCDLPWFLLLSLPVVHDLVDSTVCKVSYHQLSDVFIGSVECSADHFSCGSAQPCIPWSWRCDGHVDCTNGHDESSETCKNNSVCKCHFCMFTYVTMAQKMTGYSSEVDFFTV